MGKYGVLGSYLSSQPNSDISLSLSEVEAILRFPLPDSAREYRQWWENDANHVQARDGWLAVGWKVDAVDLARRAVSLSKSSAANRPGFVAQKKPTHIANSKSKQFEEFARRILSKRFGVALDPATLDRIPKLFDYVSRTRRLLAMQSF